MNKISSRVLLRYLASWSNHMNIDTTSPEEAWVYAENTYNKAGRDIRSVIKNFDANYLLLQEKAKKGLSIPRIQMPVLNQQDLDGFQKSLKESTPPVPVEMELIACQNLQPTQSQIWLEHLINITLDRGPEVSKQSTIVVSSEGYILDGHHKFAACILIDPNIEMSTLHVDLKIDDLLKVAGAYGDSIGNKRKHS